MKALKFGGTSMATAANVKIVADIIKSDSARKFITVSAPGRTSEEGKVTDMLIRCASASSRNAAFAPVRDRFERICSGLGIAGALEEDLDFVENSLETANYDYIVSRGEYLSAKMLAAYIGFAFVDAPEVVRFNGEHFDADKTEEICSARLKNMDNAIIPGFYGAEETGEIHTFSRGGSDITGAIIASAINAEVYENWTDVDGFMIADPRIVNKVRTIETLTYNELRELAYMGANVLHSDSVFPVRKKGIPIHILNTFNPKVNGTLIVPYEDYMTGKYKRRHHVITGIAGKRGFVALRVEKSMMNNEVGFAAKLLNCFDELGLNVEHIPSGIDTMTVVYSKTDDKKQTKLEQMVKERLAPDVMEVENDIALIAVVGHGMSQNIGVALRVIRPITNAGVNITMLDQGSSEMNIILGVSGEDYDAAIQALSEEFF